MKTISNDYPESMFITWELSNICNYSCSYCVPDLYDGSSGQPNLDSSLIFFNNITKSINPNPKLLSLSGGEPTLWPKIVDFLNRLDDSYYTEIVTNGSRTLRWWKSLFENTNNVDRVSLSVHLEFANVDHIIKLCELIHQKTLLTVMILFNPQYFEKAQLFGETLKQKQLNVSIRMKPITIKKQQVDTTDYTDYTEKQKEYIRNFVYNQHTIKNTIPISSKFIVDGDSKDVHWANNLIANNAHSFKKWWCEMGKRRLYIDHRGTVFGATCVTARKNPIGNIHTGEIKNIDGIVCTSNFCPCVPDIRIPKWRLNNKLEHEIKSRSMDKRL